MNKEKEIPEEIRKRFEDKAEAQFPEAGMNANGDKKSRQHQRAYMAGAEAMYHHLAPEIAQLKAERDAYRTVLVYLADVNSKVTQKQMKAIAWEIISKYPSPKVDKP